VSGLAASRTLNNVLWMHADSGAAAELYAVDTSGRMLGVLEMPELSWTDAEDIAAGGCPDGHGSCLWVADTGDNGEARASVSLYVIREPTERPHPSDGPTTGELVQEFSFTYEDGPHDVEALMVDTEAGTAWLIAKVDDALAPFYRLPLSGPHPHVAVLEGTFVAPGFAITRGRMVTAADLHPLGERLAVRTYTGSFELQFLGPLGPALANATLEPLAYGPLTEPQGEAIAYAADGLDFFTISEDHEGLEPQPLHRYRCHP
jgi:hypothetical protein